MTIIPKIVLHLYSMVKNLLSEERKHIKNLKISLTDFHSYKQECHNGSKKGPNNYKYWIFKLEKANVKNSTFKKTYENSQTMVSLVVSNGEILINGRLFKYNDNGVQ